MKKIMFFQNVLDEFNHSVASLKIQSYLLLIMFLFPLVKLIDRG